MLKEEEEEELELRRGKKGRKEVREKETARKENMVTLRRVKTDKERGTKRKERKVMLLLEKETRRIKIGRE